MQRQVAESRKFDPHFYFAHPLLALPLFAGTHCRRRVDSPEAGRLESKSLDPLLMRAAGQVQQPEVAAVALRALWSVG